jgi:hypothetical protein
MREQEQAVGGDAAEKERLWQQKSRAGRQAGVTQSGVTPSFFFPLYLSLSSGTDREKEERERIKRKDSGGDITLSCTHGLPGCGSK